MKTAELVRELNDRQRLYRCTPPVEGWAHDGDPPTYQYVVSSVAKSQMLISTQGCPEVYLFGADQDGDIVNWSELCGSQKGTEDIEKPLRDLGYEIVNSSPTPTE